LIEYLDSYEKYVDWEKQINPETAENMISSLDETKEKVLELINQKRTFENALVRLTLFLF